MSLFKTIFFLVFIILIEASLALGSTVGQVEEEMQSCTKPTENSSISNLTSFFRSLLSWTSMGDFEKLKVDPKCVVSFYSRLIGSQLLSLKKKDIIWESLENHVIDVNEVIRKIKGDELDNLGEIISNSMNCSESCESTKLNAVYESFLANNIVIMEQNNEGKNIKEIFEKIFKKIEDKIGQDNFIKLKKNWINQENVTRFPSAQKQNIKSEDLKNELINKNKILLMMDFFIELYGLKRNKYFENVFDSLFIEQNICYDSMFAKARGKKTNLKLKGKESNQLGISTLIVPALVLKDSGAWVHSGVNTFIDGQETAYSKRVSKQHIPLVCGVSGTTNIAIWSLFSLRVELSAQELRFFILSLWSTLCSDGGHSLQEVLSATKIVSKYVRKNKLESLLPQKTLNSLFEISKDLSVEGQARNKEFGRYYDSFFSNIIRDNPDFSEARQRAKEEFIDFYKNNCFKN